MFPSVQEVYTVFAQNGTKFVYYCDSNNSEIVAGSLVGNKQIQLVYPEQQEPNRETRWM